MSRKAAIQNTCCMGVSHVYVEINAPQALAALWGGAVAVSDHLCARRFAWSPATDSSATKPGIPVGSNCCGPRG